MSRPWHIYGFEKPSLLPQSSVVATMQPSRSRSPRIIPSDYDYQFYRQQALKARMAPSLFEPVFWDGSSIRTTAGGSGYYEIPVGHEVDVGYVAPCLIAINYDGSGVLSSNNFFAYDPLFAVTDFFGSVSNQLVDVFPEIALSQDGTTFGDWMRYQAGTYKARKFKSRMRLAALDDTVAAFVTTFVFTVYVPTRIDNWAIIAAVRTSLTNLALAAPGATLTFLPDTQATAAAFNSGVSSTTQPNIVVTILNWQTGDIAVITSVSLSQATIQITNAGIGVARNVNIRPEGY